jgi:hypothetical protein
MSRSFWSCSDFVNWLTLPGVFHRSTARVELFGSNDYNFHVARGWESKAVEAQQAEAGEKSANSRPKMTTAEASRQRVKEGLLLSRKRALNQMAESRDPRRRAMLEKALDELNEKLSRIG